MENSEHFYIRVIYPDVLFLMLFSHEASTTYGHVWIFIRGGEIGVRDVLVIF